MEAYFRLLCNFILLDNQNPIAVEDRLVIKYFRLN